MKILLLNPVCESKIKMLRSERCQVKAVSLWPPLSLAYTASVLRANGFKSVSILDAEVESLSHSEMLQQIFNECPDFIVLQETTPTIESDKSTAHAIKKQLPQVKIAFIGLHSTVRPEDILTGYVDFAVRNEPEYTITETVQAIEDRADLSSVSGLSFYADGKIIHNDKRKPIKNIDNLPFPARDLLKNELYINPTNNKPFTLIKTSRGCPFKCIYCTARPYYGKHWRSRSVDNIIMEIKDVQENYGINEFLFHSDTFNLNKTFVFELCNRIIQDKLNISWMSNCRADLFTKEQAVLMKEAGCTYISFGIESGSQELLDRMKKGITLEDAENAIKACKSANLKSIAYFIYGLPGESKKTIQDTRRFAKKLDPDIAQFFVATPFPGTEFYEMARENGWLTTEDWSKYLHGEGSVISYPDLSASELIDEKNYSYRAFYFRPGKIITYIKQTASPGQLIKQVKGFIKFYKSRRTN